MEYTIGEVSKMFNLPISTLRYYDKEGLFPKIERKSGIRKFTDKEIESLRIIECLKKSGLEIKEIKFYFELCQKGPESYQERYNLFLKQKENVLTEIKRLEDVMSTIDFKLWYYTEAIKDGNEEELKMKPEYINYNNKKNPKD